MSGLCESIIFLILFHPKVRVHSGLPILSLWSTLRYSFLGVLTQGRHWEAVGSSTSHQN